MRWQLRPGEQKVTEGQRVHLRLGLEPAPDRGLLRATATLCFGPAAQASLLLKEIGWTLERAHAVRMQRYLGTNSRREW